MNIGTWDWAKYKDRLSEILFFLPRFFRSPVSRMKALPIWDWKTILLLHSIFGFATGLLSGIFKGNLLSLIFQPIVSVVSALLIGFAGAALFYYFLLFYLDRQTDFLKLYIMVALATLPMLALRILSFIGPPINLIGFTITCFLCAVGLVENFAIERRLVIRLLGGIYALFLAIWTANVIITSREKIELKQEVAPETLDILEKEMKQTK